VGAVRNCNGMITLRIAEIDDILRHSDNFKWMGRLVNIPPHLQELFLDAQASMALPNASRPDLETLKNGFRDQLHRAQMESGIQRLTTIQTQLEQAQVAKRLRRRPIRKDARLETLRAEVRAMYKAHFTQQEIVARLAGKPRPSRALWRDLDWPVAYRKHRASVAKWLSKAARTR
jgi:hypothetical protein